jgi:hypothetical protein
MGSTAAGARSRLHEIDDRLDPKRSRTRAVEELNELFTGGHPPAPLPDGFLRGRPVTSRIAPAFDATARRLASITMPWLGKKFDAPAGRGVNILTPLARKPMKLLWPSYEPVTTFADRIEAFEFTTRIDAGALDPDVQVLKIDYDFDANPAFIIRRVLDELVQIDAGLYLGKVLYRWKGEFHSIGFFTLES